MQKWIEATGKTEDAAISAALAQLGLDRDEVSVEILDRAKTGFLGLGGSPARVRVSYEAPDAPAPAPAPRQEKPRDTPTKQDARAAAPHDVQRTAAGPTQVPAQPATAGTGPVGAAEDGDSRKEQIVAFLSGLMEHMDVCARPDVTPGPDGIYHVMLQGEGLGALIGRRGETLDAIQQLTNYAVNRGQSRRIRVHIDAEQYRGEKGGGPPAAGQKSGRKSGQIPAQYHARADERI
jgi:spoIIIJ-associated protein